MPCLLVSTFINAKHMSGEPVHSLNCTVTFAGKPFPITVTVRPDGSRFFEGFTATVGFAAVWVSASRARFGLSDGAVAVCSGAQANMASAMAAESNLISL